MIIALRSLVSAVGMLAIIGGTVIAQNSPTLIHQVNPPNDPACTGIVGAIACGRVLVRFRVTIGTNGSIVNAVVLPGPIQYPPHVVNIALTAVYAWRYLPVAAPVDQEVIVQWTMPTSTPGPPGPAELPPREPQNFRATYVGGILTLTWEPPATTGVLGTIVGGTPTSYVLRAGYLPSIMDLVEFDTGSLATTFSAYVPPGYPPRDTGGRSASPGGQLYVGVYARNAAGTSAGNIILVLTGAPTAGCTSAPSAPSSLTVTVQGSRVTFSWGAAVGADNYVLEAGSQSGSANLVSSNIGAQTTFEATAPPGTYFVRVRGVNPCGVSAASNEVIVVVSGGGVPPGVPPAGPWLPCSRAVASIASVTPVPVEFVNTSNQPRLLYWIDFGGTQRPYGVLLPGQSGFITSFVTHSWVVTDATNTCLGTTVITGNGGRLAVP